jgi:hypothetical protein
VHLSASNAEWRLNFEKNLIRKPGNQEKSKRRRTAPWLQLFETRSLPTLADCFPRNFTFCVARPTRSIRSRHGCHYSGHYSARALMHRKRLMIREFDNQTPLLQIFRRRHATVAVQKRMTAFRLDLQQSGAAG